MLLISKTYEIITEESSEQGESAENGFIFEDSEYTVREIAKEIRGLFPSQFPIKDIAHVWFTDYGSQDCETGNVENTALHYSYNNSKNNLKYWRAAILAAGFEIKD